MDYPRIHQRRRVRRAGSTPSQFSEPEKYELREDERPVSDHERSSDYTETDMRWKWAGAVDFDEAVKEYGYENVRWSRVQNRLRQDVVEVYCKLI